MPGWSSRFNWGASGAVDFGTEEGRAFLQQRLAFFGKVGLLIDAGFVVFGSTALLVSIPGLLQRREAPGALVYHLIDIINLALFLGTWLVCRRGRRPLALLRALDVCVVFAFCTIVAAASSYAPPEMPGVRWTALLIVTNVLMARAVMVPSTPRRTFRIGIACTLPTLLLTREMSIVAPLFDGPPARVSFLVPAAMWSLCGIVLSTVASGVIYGLQRRVSEARRLGQYTLEARLGEGGMGIVYRARHAMLRRPTAVKLLPPERAGVQNIARFEREVQATAQLSHPNTVAIFDYGRTPDGIFYYAMEYLEGIDLEALVRCFGAQPPGRVVHVLRQVAGALGEAHARGLIHRDVKPGNVILCSRGGAPDVAKVVDFGLVRDLAAARPLTETAADLVTGTPLYLSPEAITTPDRLDARADLYALGALGYFLLAGRNAFDGATVVEVCAHHLHTVPDPPSRRLGRPLPRDLEQVLLGCLEKQPERRPQTAAQLIEQLEACACTSEWGERQAREWWRSNEQRAREAHARPSEGTGRSALVVSIEDRIGIAVPGGE